MTEIWYARLLRLYPADYPRDEMLDVLLASGRPVRHEVFPLVLGGLRARAGGRQTLTERWLYAARAAALMLLAGTVTAQVAAVAAGWPKLTAILIATWACAALAAAAVMLGARLPAAVFVLAAMVLAADDWRSVTAYSLAAALLIIPGPRTPVASPLPVLIAVGTIAVVLPLLPYWSLEALVLAALAWSVIDERLLLAIGLALCVRFIQATGEFPAAANTYDVMVQLGFTLGIPAVFLAVGAAIATRRARV